MEDLYKRKLQRIKTDEVEKNSLQITSQLKSIRYRNHLQKFIIIVLVFGTTLGILTSPTIYVQENFSLAVSQPDIVTRLLGTSDLRYVSDLEIKWDDISHVLEQLLQKDEIHGVGLLNFNTTEISQWKKLVPSANHTLLQLENAEKNLTWDSLYPEWIDEEQVNEVPSCPTLPKLEVPINHLDLVAVKLPCSQTKNWMRDVPRLHLQLAVAGLVTSAKGLFPVHILFITKCFPVPNLFPCNGLAGHVGFAWLYKPNIKLATEKCQLPQGSCELAVPLGVRAQDLPVKKQREAYATILVGAQLFICGAIVAAQSIRMSGSTKDLVVLVDEKMDKYHKNGLQMAGWEVRTIKGIRNPKARKEAYNEWNYSKFRLWQLTDYDKIIFIDSDLLIRRNIDFLFTMPEITARGNHGTLFNTGVMVIEPSNCTFQLLMDHLYEFESYNGGDQGYLNEIFPWWHRMPERLNFLKNFLAYQSDEVNQKKIQLIAAEPPILYVIHYLGFYKPWMCSRDYDCNWNVGKLQEFASDDAHRIWWRAHDAMLEKLQGYCMLKARQRAQLEYDRREAEKRNYTDGHWKIVIKDPRYTNCSNLQCNKISEKMLWRWGVKD
ncbi:OLC1v1030730C1 [Oldenlandia corymbosa var. corymbosa]|uniref:Hexosyltransferase n=1 Tax=Oldenlandia corymbosa var. corymbosa TaxID=529605 RepID=A0AAV1CHG0_OLDCO|nr:OLC1v1030730C1 [Oldenlandia corymbosa var. corymbosa]